MMHYFMYEGQVYHINRRCLEGLKVYIEHGARPGGFLSAVLANDFVEIVAAADGENMQNLPAYADYLYNHAPRDCWGSKQALEAWIKKKREERE